MQLSPDQKPIFHLAKHEVIEHVLFKNPFPGPEALSRLQCDAWRTAEEEAGVRVPATPACYKQVRLIYDGLSRLTS